MMIDGLRTQLQRRRDELASELQRIEGALAALGDRAGNVARPGSTVTARVGTSTLSGGASVRERRSADAARRPRASRGELKAKVLGELHASEAKTARAIAAKLDLAPASVSAVLVKAVKQGEARKAKPTGYLAASAAPRPMRSTRARRTNATKG